MKSSVSTKQTRLAVVGSLIAAMLATLAGGSARAEDWPTYMHDARRSGITAESLNPSQLQQDWVYVSPNSPQRAWAGPAPRDFYGAPKMDIKPRMDFDRVFYVTAVGNKIYFGSSADDSVHCLDARSGEPLWQFYTEGPVRMAPAIDGGRVYAGSDDGWVYCLDAKSGSVIWKHLMPDNNYRVPTDGKFISLWPIRSSILVDGGVAYCNAGFLAQETVYIAALDALTGLPQGPGRWKIARKADYSLQGYMLASADKLYMPAGRATPYIFDRANGNKLGQVKSGGGGTYALLTDDDELIFGPSKSNQMEVTKSRSVMVSFDGNRMIVAPKTSYMQTDSAVTALDRLLHKQLTEQRRKLAGQKAGLEKQIKELRNIDSPALKALKDQLPRINIAIGEIGQKMAQTIRWSEPCPYNRSMILAGDVLFVGGDQKIGAIATRDGSELWNAEIDGGAWGLTVANGGLYVSTDAGLIYRFSDRSKTVTMAR